jgi:hypothetical protein
MSSLRVLHMQYLGGADYDTDQSLEVEKLIRENKR